MDIETVAATTPEKIVTRDIDPTTGVTDADAQALTAALRLEQPARGEAKPLFASLYNAFVEKDMSLLEINPLVIPKSRDPQGGRREMLR